MSDTKTPWGPPRENHQTNESTDIQKVINDIRNAIKVVGVLGLILVVLKIDLATAEIVELLSDFNAQKIKRQVEEIFNEINKYMGTIISQSDSNFIATKVTKEYQKKTLKQGHISFQKHTEGDQVQYDVKEIAKTPDNKKDTPAPVVAVIRSLNNAQQRMAAQGCPEGTTITTFVDPTVVKTESAKVVSESIGEKVTYYFQNNSHQHDDGNVKIFIQMAKKISLPRLSSTTKSSRYARRYALDFDADCASDSVLPPSLPRMVRFNNHVYVT